MSIDYLGVESVGVKYVKDRLWVCINGTCVLRVKGMKDYDYDDSVNYDPMTTAVALSLYAYNISAEERAEKLFKYFEGNCLPLSDMIKVLNAHATYAATELPYSTAVVYVTQALERYGEEAAERCAANSRQTF